ncbi:hypothetical protein Cgig2_021976 [Carnegiea gigantea]|uniref:Uncharacterized protein n=1 Tax=Carnegiea gigantea TaxID=171969 RepID=A0A9Q1QMN9_9CARY|nr:hypothetical protein Cgig2_021976 [Carnegiea gigantea]
MEKANETAHPGAKHLNLKKSFRQAVRSLLTAFPFELFEVPVVKLNALSLAIPFHRVLQSDCEPGRPATASLCQDEFHSLCDETQVGTILDTVEHLVEQQSLDPLFSDNSLVKHPLVQLRNYLLHLQFRSAELHVQISDRITEDYNSCRTNVGHLKHDLLAIKKNEIHLLESLLQKVEDQKHSTKARIKLLKNKNEDTSGSGEAVRKLRSMMEKYGSYSHEETHVQ